MSTVSPTERARTDSMNDMLANNWWAAALRGVIAILFGIAALTMPVVTMLSLALVFGAFSFVDGILTIIMAIRGARRGNSWVWLLLNGLFGILAGIVAFVWPGLTVLAFVLLVAAWSLVTGVAMLISAFRLKVAHGRAWLVVGGIASVALGILLVLSPLAGALVLTFWIGAMSIVLGISLLVLAYRLRSQRTHVPHDFAAATPA
ncbi:HdeD family acid-resistance protein [Pseudaminobacter sp. 19-2017]|uniref:HdeD family acid-resistance protein n=1 Tax=Pseudaminobacter soli (ex Zhang et al. 2022) TaxID=2831468 RepID=A0A942E1L9_9HYPH|nr:HdeD family acid-resistance protein [Pseudaminobacter soli]MBS3652109.1 HdeD family acid-resistance protein [Pseudaminobacter soli]